MHPYRTFTRIRSSLFTKLAGLFGLTIVILFGISFLYFRNTVSVTLSQAQKQNEVLAQTMAASIGGLEEINAKPSDSQYEKLFEPLSVNKHILSYSLIARDGSIVYSKDPLLTGGKVSSFDVLSRSQLKNLTTKNYTDAEFKQPVSSIITPVYTHSAAKQSLQIIFSTKELNDLQRQDYLSFSAITLLVAAIAGLSLYYLSRLIRTPLAAMMKGVAALSASDFDYRIQLHRQDEIGLLATAFNHMASSLQESRTHLTNERALLIEAKAELMASVKSLPFGFALINNSREILYSNDALANIIGRPIPLDPHESRKLLENLDAEYKHSFDLTKTIEDVAAKATPVEYNLPVGVHFYRILLSPVQVRERVIGTILIIEDITEAKVLERSRDEFFSIASHELRTPLTTIRGNTNLILDYYEKQLKDPALHQMMNDIHESSVRLIAIVNDFLDVSRLEQNRMTFKIEPVDITRIIKTALDQYKSADLLHGLTLTFNSPGPCWVNADGDKALQVINNLVSNAIKYTDTGGVTLSIENDGKKVRILVTDTGNGIPEESQHLLFHKFQQASNNILTRDNSQSTGLGLYISSLLGHGMKGKVSMLKSKLGEGTTFYFELPVAHSHTVATKIKG